MKETIPPAEAERVTVMGLGLHGGGLASALFFARRGARVTVTDLKSASDLQTSMDQLSDYNIRYTLGRHETADFTDTDLVIKNPGVGTDSPFLAAARAHGVPVESDISVFLSLAPNPILAVTGSKGKSTATAAAHAGLVGAFPEAKLGGNIAVSPLTFLEGLPPDAPVALELSSWQLADIKDCPSFKPRVSLITNILPDHLNRYHGMEDYVADKKLIYARQDRTDVSVFNLDDPYTVQFRAESRARQFFFSRQRLPRGMEGGWLESSGGGILSIDGRETALFSRPPVLTGDHNRLNLLAAALCLRGLGLAVESFAEGLTRFPGLEHRFELAAEKRGVRYINDSAATIPHAVREALAAVAGSVILITGGTDKNIDFTPFAEALRVPKMIILLEGSATEKIIRLLNSSGIPFRGPHSALEPAVREAAAKAVPGDTVLFSPGCASFGMFLNEFDRGRRFKKIVQDL